jgi:hypothetical protein
VKFLRKDGKTPFDNFLSKDYGINCKNVDYLVKPFAGPIEAKIKVALFNALENQTEKILFNLMP